MICIKLRRCDRLAVNLNLKLHCGILHKHLLKGFLCILCSYIFQDAKTEWSQILWVDLNIQLLQGGIEGFLRRLRQLPKDAQVLSVAFYLEGHMKEFRESLPLLLDLKNEALRERSV